MLAAAQQGGVINVYGEAGIGKTHVLSHVAHDPAGGAFPDGIVHVDALDAPLDDALQALFEEFYDCGDPAVRPSRSRLRRALHDRRALVVVDDLGLQREEAQAVLSAAPGCAFVVASTARTVWDGEAIQLAGLHLEFALAIVEQEIGRPLTPEERVEAESLCNALGGHPWRIREAAARARDEGRSLAEAARALDPTAMLAALTSGEESVLAGLAAVGGGPVGLEHVRELSPVEDVGPVLESLERRHLVLTHSPRYSLPEPLAEEIGRRTDLEPLRARAMEHFTDWAERERDPVAVAAERPAVLELLRWASRTGRDKDAIRLGRASQDAFAAAGRFGAWGAAVETVLAAARRQGDPFEEAWALHQRGTRTFALDESKAALPDLERARTSAGRSATSAARRRASTTSRSSRAAFPWWYARFGRGGGWLLVLIAIGLVLIAAAVGGALALRDDDEGPTTTTGGLVVVPGSSASRSRTRGRARGRGASGRRRATASGGSRPGRHRAGSGRGGRGRARLGGQPRRRRPVGARPGRPRARGGRRDERLGERRPPRSGDREGILGQRGRGLVSRPRTRTPMPSFPSTPSSN